METRCVIFLTDHMLILFMQVTCCAILLWCYYYITRHLNTYFTTPLTKLNIEQKLNHMELLLDNKLFILQKPEKSASIMNICVEYDIFKQLCWGKKKRRSLTDL